MEHLGLSEWTVEGVSTTAEVAVLLLTGDSGAADWRPLFLLCGGVNIPTGTSSGLGGEELELDSANRLCAAS